MTPADSSFCHDHEQPPSKVIELADGRVLDMCEAAALIGAVADECASCVERCIARVAAAAPEVTVFVIDFALCNSRPRVKVATRGGLMSQVMLGSVVLGDLKGAVTAVDSMKAQERVEVLQDAMGWL